MTFSSFRQEAWNARVIETMTFNRFRQEVWNYRVVETMTFNSFRQEAAYNERVVETITAVLDKKPILILLYRQ